MKVLVIGSGGREHALVWKISQSPRVERIYCAPGNGGIGRIAELVPVGPEEIEKIADFAARERIDLTVVGPELPLTLGISDLFEKRALKIFGPNREAARLGGSRPSPKITKIGVSQDWGLQSRQSRLSPVDKKPGWQNPLYDTLASWRNWWQLAARRMARRAGRLRLDGLIFEVALAAGKF